MVVLGGMCRRVRVLLHGISYLWFRDIVLVLFLFLLHELFVLDGPFHLNKYTICGFKLLNNL
jgi:hypothetical protein